jgi:organic hydroperoxide reductase OsmC/OhrA
MMQATKTARMLQRAGSQRGMASLSKVIFTAGGQSDTGTREGTVKSFGEHHSGQNMKLEKHPDHGGKGGATNPEELFAMGYSACFNGALRLVADKNGIKIGESTVKANVSLGVVSEEVTAGVPLRGARAALRSNRAARLPAHPTPCPPRSGPRRQNPRRGGGRRRRNGAEARANGTRVLPVLARHPRQHRRRDLRRRGQVIARAHADGGGRGLASASCSVNQR